MRRQVRKVAVLGSGVMGSAIAAHFANAGIRALVLDVVPKELSAAEESAGIDPGSPKFRNRIARDCVAALKRARPAPYFTPERARWIEIGNFEDDLERLAEADWVIEAVKEDLAIKSTLLARAAPHLNPHAVLTSNTSGLPLTEMARALPEEMRPRFLGAHFFNPPRYMKLLELIPTADTDPAEVDALEQFASERLGKGVVRARDTPNFIANRIGVHSLMVTLRVMERSGLRVEEIDALTGPLMARPKSATFRLCDMVGLDTLLFVARNVYDHAPEDEHREQFVPPEFLQQMVRAGMLGLKSGGGFYRKEKRPGKKILVLDPNSREYRDPVRPEFPELAGLERVADPRERLRRLAESEGPGADAAWEILAPTLVYAAFRLGEIAADAATIDRAIRWGFNWKLGPFEIWDAIGFRRTTERLREDGTRLPEWITARYDAGATALYEEKDGVAWAPAAGGVSAPAATDPREVTFERLRKYSAGLPGNDSASVSELGEGVLVLEFHSKMNAIDGGTIEMIFAAADEAERSGRALLIANDGENFCAGANLEMLAGLAERRDWAAIERTVAEFQRATDRLESCSVPVVAVPHGMALGGGCEVVLAADRVRAAAEAYIGLVELGAGLIPAGGGCMRLYRRMLDRRSDPYPALIDTFETIGQAKVSTSAEEARTLGFLRPADGWSMNADYRVTDAARLASASVRSGYVPPAPALELAVLGREGVALIEAVLVGMLEGRYVSEHDRVVGRELARVLSGGDVAGPTVISQQHMLDLERESFVRLCGEAKTRERMVALLKTGKPLRN